MFKWQNQTIHNINLSIIYKFKEIVNENNFKSIKFRSSKIPKYFDERTRARHQIVREYVKGQVDIMSRKNVETVNYEDGSVFRGQIDQDGIKNGVGMQFGADGSVYMGRWENDIYHKEGIYLYPDGERYEGEIFQGNKEGHGKMFYLNGDIYDGEWAEGDREGRGQITYANGDRYDGQWKENKTFGNGRYFNGRKLIAEGKWNDSTFLNGKVSISEYEGEWAFGTPNGKGTFKFQDGSVYSGQWMHGQKNGEGTYQFTNGDVYEGQFRCGLKHGHGLYRYSTGDTYDGQYHNDLKNGHGVMRFYNGDQYKGNWQSDVFHGQGTYSFNGKDSISGRFSYGTFLNEQSISEKVSQQGFPKSNIREQSFPQTPLKVQKDYRLLRSQGRVDSMGSFTPKNYSSSRKIENSLSFIK